jgi:hypothetical protein
MEIQMNKYPKLLLASIHEVFIPFHFASDFNYVLLGLEEEDIIKLLRGPKGNGYWESWYKVIKKARYVDSDGTVWVLNHDGDLWLVPEGFVENS